MTPYFTRLKFAFRTFFSILDHDRIPDDVAAALGAAGRPSPAAVAAPPAAAATPESKAPAAARQATATDALAVLQRDGRLIDFLMEDLTPYADAQIGAAVRDVHAGCRQALQRYVTLAPVLDGEEGAAITVEKGTDPALVKVVGNVVGQPPYRGVLRHRGWRVSRIELPESPPSGRLVIAPAEVEIGG